MNQEKIGNIIKDLRTKDKLSQQKFAEKYGVTYQAVSKWENGKNIPDIAILKQICDDYHLNLNDILEDKKTTKKSKKYIFIIVGLILIIFIILSLFFINSKDEHFEFKTLSSSCSNFNLFGSMAYNKNKTSIYISNITYCGGDDDTLYSKIECTLYEENDKIKTVISESNYAKENPITLENFLKEVNFNVDNYEKTCKVYKENSLHLEIEATNLEGKITTYKIPLKLEGNCLK